MAYYNANAMQCKSCNASHAVPWGKSMQMQAIRLTAMQITCSMQVMVYYRLGLLWLTTMQITAQQRASYASNGLLQARLTVAYCNACPGAWHASNGLLQARITVMQVIATSKHAQCKSWLTSKLAMQIARQCM